MWLDIHDINNDCCQCHTSSPLTVTGAANNNNNRCAQASLLSKVSKTVKYSLTYWLITHPAPYRFRQCGSGCHIATAISTTLMTPSNVFWPPTTPRHVFQAPYMHLNPSATCFDHLQPSDMHLDPLSNLFQPPTTPRHVFQTLDTCLNPSVTCFNHLQPSDTRLDPSGLSNLFRPPTTISTPHTTPRHMFRAPDMHLNPSATCFNAPNPFLHPRSQNTRTIVHVFLHIYIL